MACASCWKRRNRSGSRAKAAGKTLIATSRLSRASRARYTSPMPPAPTADTISYGPSFVPGVRAIRARNYRLFSTLHWMQRFWAVGRQTGSNSEMDFLTPLGRLRSRHPHPEGSESGVREAAMTALRFFYLPRHTRLESLRFPEHVSAVPSNVVVGDH